MIYPCTYFLKIHVSGHLESFSLSLSSLFWWWGRGYNLSLTWDQPIANHNHPISWSYSFQMRFTQIYTIRKKRLSQLPFHVDFKPFIN